MTYHRTDHSLENAKGRLVDCLKNEDLSRLTVRRSDRIALQKRESSTCLASVVTVAVANLSGPLLFVFKFLARVRGLKVSSTTLEGHSTVPLVSVLMGSLLVEMSVVLLVVVCLYAGTGAFELDQLCKSRPVFVELVKRELKWCAQLELHPLLSGHARHRHGNVLPES
ncbi:hypothetical protein K474DRAFT_1665694, partial [Panus rudis PR-1116 ss-1]